MRPGRGPPDRYARAPCGGPGQGPPLRVPPRRCRIRVGGPLVCLGPDLMRPARLPRADPARAAYRGGNVGAGPRPALVDGTALRCRARRVDPDPIRLLCADVAVPADGVARLHAEGSVRTGARVLDEHPVAVIGIGAGLLAHDRHETDEVAVRARGLLDDDRAVRVDDRATRAVGLPAREHVLGAEVSVAVLDRRDGLLVEPEPVLVAEDALGQARAG